MAVKGVNVLDNGLLYADIEDGLENLKKASLEVSQEVEKFDETAKDVQQSLKECDENFSAVKLIADEIAQLAGMVRADGNELAAHCTGLRASWDNFSTQLDLKCEKGHLDSEDIDQIVKELKQVLDQVAGTEASARVKTMYESLTKNLDTLTEKCGLLKFKCEEIEKRNDEFDWIRVAKLVSICIASFAAVALKFSRNRSKEASEAVQVVDFFARGEVQHANMIDLAKQCREKLEAALASLKVTKDNIKGMQVSTEILCKNLQKAYKKELAVQAGIQAAIQAGMAKFEKENMQQNEQLDSGQSSPDPTSSERSSRSSRPAGSSPSSPSLTYVHTSTLTVRKRCGMEASQHSSGGHISETSSSSNNRNDVPIVNGFVVLVFIAGLIALLMMLLLFGVE